ncbi:MAG: hypothetical protein IKO80_01460 [Lachnospiraceae bacterium]|nr:hypothetical protein [Lachnospiraceae bacterium]
MVRFDDLLTFDPEHQLSKEPLCMDMLIIKKDPEAVIDVDIGRIFRGHNIVEYKSPADSLSIDDLYKTIGYAFLYKGMGATVDAIPADELTVSVFHDRYPRKMMDTLQKLGASIEEKYPGIYYVTWIPSLPIQIVVMSRLSEDHAALRILSDRARVEDVERFVNQTADLTDPGDRANIDAVLQVSIAANRAVYAKLKEEQNMSDIVNEWIHEMCKEDFEEAEKQGILKALSSLVRNGLLSVSNAAAEANMSESAFMASMKKLYP